jgi:putative ABC transport system permease protein
VRYFKTDNFELFAQNQVDYAGTGAGGLTWVHFSCAEGLQDQVEIEAGGSFPSVATPTADSTVEVLISAFKAEETGMQVGETYIAYLRQETEYGERTTQVPIRIAGVWRPRDRSSEYWFYPQSAFNDTLFVPEETFAGRLSAFMEEEVYVGLWYLVMDGEDVHIDDVNGILGRTTSVQQRAASILPGVRLEVSPVDALHRYRTAAAELTFMLIAFSVPIIGLVLAFIGLVVGLAVSRQRNEIAVLRSRGATGAQVVGIAFLEGLLLGAIALIFSLPVGQVVAHLIGRARSFLDFSLASGLRVDVTMTSMQFGFAAAALALSAQVVPTIAASRHTVVTYKQERARSMRPPWWQRAWLDLLLLIPTGYGAYLLREQGGILPGGEGVGSSDPFQNPLLFLVPALGIFALTLFILRILPLAMAGMAWAAARTNRVGMLMAARHLARTPGFYSAPLLLLVLTLSLSTFTASLAQTLDRHLYDQTYYEAGADMMMVEMGESTEAGGGAFFGAPETSETEQGETQRWLFRPVSDHLEVEGVEKATRLGRYDAVTQLSGGSQAGVYYGIDFFGFDEIAFWRSDFASQNLGELRNALGLVPEGVLVNRSFLAAHALNTGDTFRINIRAYGTGFDMDVRVVGHFDLFPTWYEVEDGPLFVGNLPYLYEQAMEQLPYRVLLKTDPEADSEEIVSGVRGLGLSVADWDAPRMVIAEEQRRPERQGLFGVLSVGFLAAALLTVLGFMFYAFFSFRRRFIELGVLRAIGLSTKQMTAFLAWELAFLVLVGLFAGTGLGIWVSGFFIPHLQVGSGPSAQTPPFVVEIAWDAVFQIYVLFALLFVAALGVLVALLRRMKIFQAVKLGETT